VQPIASGLVDITRDFLAAHAIATRIAARHRAGELAFEELLELVGNDEGAALFRLKERCHALFRSTRASGVAASREALFDLVVGALFHEAMKFRESFYQQSVYGPKIRALRKRTADPDEATLFGEFEKIVGATSVRLDEALQETEALLEQARRQFLRLLTEHRSNGLVARYLVQHPELVEAVFPEGLDALLAEIYGAASEGYGAAARSYLASGYFAEAEHALAEAVRRDGEGPEIRALRAFATGMRAHAEGHYTETLERLGAWLDAGGAADPVFADLAWSAISRVAERASRSDRALADQARALAAGIAPHAPRASRARRAADVAAQGQS
jgi:hypothetical protein